MKPKEFDRVANELFGEVLRPNGFTNERSCYCVFYREQLDSIFHVIAPNILSRGVCFDVKVFFTSPIIDPTFELAFPDELGMPTGPLSHLSSRGIHHQELFNCKHEENFRRRFEVTVKPLLLNKALPYLDRIRSVKDMIPLINSPLHLGIALNHVGRTWRARWILRGQKKRLDFSDARGKLWLKAIDDVLCPFCKRA